MTRFLDIFFSGLAILFLSPLILSLVVILRFTGEGKIFYLQNRVGKNRKLFKLIKFVTMIENSSKIGTGTITIENDPRILPFGFFLRKTKLNELPQLFNVFLGNMTIIGPRPQTERCFGAYSSEAKEAVVSVKPGLSGIGSIFFRDEEEMYPDDYDIDLFYNNVIMFYKGNLETWFLKNNNLKMYFILIFLTIFFLFSPSKKILWKLFSDLPTPPDSLKKFI
tara:strand:+ start:19648 stop:20313 length:666 start_codon:yes stop_codon:yes gene_type:complete